MFRFLRCKTLFLRFSSIQPIRIQSLPNPSWKCDYQTNPPSSLFQYLQTSIGLSPERALTISHWLRRCNPKNPDSVLTFFKSLGFSETHIKSIIDRAPFLLYCAPESRLRPKVQFLKDKGISESDLVDLVVSNPYLFIRSLERHIKPLLDVLCSILGTDEFAVNLLIRSKLMFHPDILSANLSILRDCGAQNHHISKLFMRRPQVLKAKFDRFSEVVEMVKGMGLEPKRFSFVDAVFTIVSLGRQKWDAKFKLYTSFGWSAEEVLSLFRKQPACMRLSEEKIRKGVVYLTKELGWDTSYILIYPNMLSLSLEKRIVPRHRFLQFLASKGFTEKDKMSASSFMLSEKTFLKYFVMRYESEVPDILKTYDSLMRGDSC